MLTVEHGIIAIVVKTVIKTAIGVTTKQSASAAAVTALAKVAEAAII